MMKTFTGLLLILCLTLPLLAAAAGSTPPLIKIAHQMPRPRLEPVSVLKGLHFTFAPILITQPAPTTPAPPTIPNMTVAAEPYKNNNGLVIPAHTLWDPATGSGVSLHGVKMDNSVYWLLGRDPEAVTLQLYATRGASTQPVPMITADFWHIAPGQHEYMVTFGLTPIDNKYCSQTSLTINDQKIDAAKVIYSGGTFRTLFTIPGNYPSDYIIIKLFANTKQSDYWVDFAYAQLVQLD